MAPTAHVIVYYVGNDGEIIADALDVELEGVLQNFVSEFRLTNVDCSVNTAYFISFI